MDYTAMITRALKPDVFFKPMNPLIVGK